MIDAPPEVATARELLRQVAPLQGSKKRVYQKVVASRARHKRVGMRFAIVGFCLAASTSAMAYGYRWVTHRAPVPSSISPSTIPSSRAERVPRRQNRSDVTADTRAKDDSENSALPTATSSNPAARTPSPGVASAMSSQRAVESAGAHEPPTAVAAEASELSQQVRDYHEAVAPMRANPQLALSRLQAYRSKWPQSAIGEEVDLRVIEALLALGRRHEAANAAGRFLRRYPGSARAAEIRRLAEESARPGVFED